MSKILLSIEPIEAARWVDYMPGVRFQVEAITSEDNDAAKLANTDMLGRLNVGGYGIEVLVARGKLKAWEGLGDVKTQTMKTCSPENITALIKHQGERMVPFLCGAAISIENYRVQEVEAAKKG